MDNVSITTRISNSGSASNSQTSSKQTYAVNTSPWPSFDVNYTYGTGPYQCNLFFQAKDPITADATIDLSVGTVHAYTLSDLLDYEGNPISFSVIKRIQLAILTPDGVKELRFGPMGESHGCLLWFDDLQAWAKTRNYILEDDPITGWPVVPGVSDVIGVWNPSGFTEPTGEDTQYALLIAGISA